MSSIRRLRPRRLSKNEIFFPTSRKAKIITTPLKYSGTGIHALKYFDDLSASGGLKFETAVPPKAEILREVLI